MLNINEEYDLCATNTKHKASHSNKINEDAPGDRSCIEVISGYAIGVMHFAACIQTAALQIMKEYCKLVAFMYNGNEYKRYLLWMGFGLLLLKDNSPLNPIHAAHRMGRVLNKNNEFAFIPHNKDGSRLSSVSRLKHS